MALMESDRKESALEELSLIAFLPQPSFSSNPIRLSSPLLSHPSSAAIDCSGLNLNLSDGVTLAGAFSKVSDIDTGEARLSVGFAISPLGVPNYILDEIWRISPKQAEDLP